MTRLSYCQAVGCVEIAVPWATEVTLDDDVTVEVVLCRRHERSVIGHSVLTTPQPSTTLMTAERVA